MYLAFDVVEQEDDAGTEEAASGTELDYVTVIGKFPDHFVPKRNVIQGCKGRVSPKPSLVQTNWCSTVSLVKQKRNK